MNLLLIYVVIVVGLALIVGLISLIADLTAPLRNHDPYEAFLGGCALGAVAGICIVILVNMVIAINHLAA